MCLQNAPVRRNLFAERLNVSHTGGIYTRTRAHDFERDLHQSQCLIQSAECIVVLWSAAVAASHLAQQEYARRYKHGRQNVLCS
jgi:hypothetical protein